MGNMPDRERRQGKEEMRRTDKAAGRFERTKKGRENERLRRDESERNLRDSGGKPDRKSGNLGGKPERRPRDLGGKPERRPGDSGGKPERRPGDFGGKPERRPGDFGEKPERRPGDSGGKPDRKSGNLGGKPERRSGDLGGKPERKSEGGKAKLCPVSSKCGGCQWIHINYKDQVEVKAARFRKMMEPYCKTEPLIAMEDPAHYRNKVHAVFGEDRKHNAISGTYEEKSHRIVPVDNCLIENQKADEIIISIRGLLKSFKIRPYNEDTGYGLLRHVVVRVGHVTGQIMVVLVLTSPILPSKNHFVKALRQLHPEISTIVINVNDRDTSMVLGEKEQVIYGKGYIEDVLCGRTFRISPRSFYQVNPVQTEKLYAKAIEYAGLTGRETVLDAYCGTGTIGLVACGRAGEVIGVELNRDAVRDAVSNARRNGAANIHFYQNDAGKFLMEMAEQSAKLDVLFMDPPRSGSDEAFLDAVVKIRPQRVVYISCNPETLVRDLEYLCKKGYCVKKSVAVDMFPYTESLEAVCLLSSRNAKPDTRAKRRAEIKSEENWQG